MDTETNILLIQKILKNDVLFESIDDINNFKVLKCEDYDDLNLYKCSKQLDPSISIDKYIENLAKINIRTSLFDSFVQIEKLNELENNKWTEKTIYNDKDYNIQIYEKGDNYIMCYSDLKLDDNSYKHNWINNPFTLVQVDNCIKLFIAFEISNLNQSDLLGRFLDCLLKLEKALKN